MFLGRNTITPCGIIPYVEEMTNPCLELHLLLAQKESKLIPGHRLHPSAGWVLSTLHRSQYTQLKPRKAVLGCLMRDVF